MNYDFNSLQKTVAEATNRPLFYTDFEDVPTDKIHQISELTEWIRTKSKGSDIREIIAQLFERTLLEGSREGNANLEVAEARGRHETLGERLSFIIQNLDRKGDELELKRLIDSIIAGSPKGVYPSLNSLQAAKPNGEQGVFVTSDNGHWYYWDNQWRDGGVYQGKTVQIGRAHV